MLQVADAQGKTDFGKVAFTVEEDKDVLSSVEIIFDQELGSLTQAELRYSQLGSLTQAELRYTQLGSKYSFIKEVIRIDFLKV